MTQSMSLFYKQGKGHKGTMSVHYSLVHRIRALDPEEQLAPT